MQDHQQREKKTKKAEKEKTKKEEMKSYYETENGKLYCCDNVEYLKSIDDNTFDLTVTSPPYDNLRNYNGFSWDFEALARELYRTTKQGGVVVWVVADQTKDFSESGTSFKQALGFIAAGWNLFDTMIWRKSNYMPGHKERYADEFEYMFVFSIGKPKTFNPLKTKCITAGRSQKWAKRPHESKVWVKNGARYRETLDFKIKGNVWEYSTGRGGSTNDRIALRHPAIFPEKLAADHIISWSNENDIVFDPFMGSGTTAKMAERSKRRWIGCEISKEYCDIIVERVENERTQLTLNFT